MDRYRPLTAVVRLCRKRVLLGWLVAGALAGSDTAWSAEPNRGPASDGAPIVEGRDLEPAAPGWRQPLRKLPGWMRWPSLFSRDRHAEPIPPQRPEYPQPAGPGGAIAGGPHPLAARPTTSVGGGLARESAFGRSHLADPPPLPPGLAREQLAKATAAGSSTTATLGAAAAEQPAGSASGSPPETVPAAAQVTETKAATTWVARQTEPRSAESPRPEATRVERQRVRRPGPCPMVAKSPADVQLSIRTDVPAELAEVERVTPADTQPAPSASQIAAYPHCQPVQLSDVTGEEAPVVDAASYYQRWQQTAGQRATVTDATPPPAAEGTWLATYQQLRRQAESEKK